MSSYNQILHDEILKQTKSVLLVEIRQLLDIIDLFLAYATKKLSSAQSKKVNFNFNRFNIVGVVEKTFTLGNKILSKQR